MIEDRAVRPTGSMVASLLFDQGSREQIPALLRDFSLVENYSTVCKDWMFCVSLFFVHVLSCVVFRGGPCTLLTTGETFQLCVFFYM